MIPLILGIAASQYLSGLFPTYIFSSIIISFALLFIVQKIRSELPFVLLTFWGLFATGVYLSDSQTPKIISGETYPFSGRCEQILSPGKIIISSPHLCTYLQLPDSTEISVGDSLSGLVRLYPLQASHHRYDFNYNNYLRHQGIDTKGFPVGKIHKTGHSQDLYSLCHVIRNHLVAKLKRVIPDSTTHNLLAALCLGHRQEISPNIKELFQNTGTIHILAISGLHIGVIFIFFSYLLKLLRLKSKTSHLILIPLIWFVVGITGLSPSACRAATILSFIIIGKVFRQETIPLNAIAAAAFFSLLINPELLYSVSFQMSYAAYTGIILIYPLMRLKKMHKLIRPLYTLFCISFSAQVMTLPIMAYYFHSISLNSILINIIAVPIASFLLYGGIILLCPTRGYWDLFIIYHHRGHTLIYFLPAIIFQDSNKPTRLIPDNNSHHIILPCHYPCYHLFNHKKTSCFQNYLLLYGHIACFSLLFLVSHSELPGNRDLQHL